MPRPRCENCRAENALLARRPSLRSKRPCRNGLLSLSEGWVGKSGFYFLPALPCSRYYPRLRRNDPPLNQASVHFPAEIEPTSWNHISRCLRYANPFRLASIFFPLKPTNMRRWMVKQVNPRLRPVSRCSVCRPTQRVNPAREHVGLKSVGSVTFSRQPPRRF